VRLPGAECRPDKEVVSLVLLQGRVLTVWTHDRFVVLELTPRAYSGPRRERALETEYAQVDEAGSSSSIGSSGCDGHAAVHGSGWNTGREYRRPSSTDAVGGSQYGWSCPSDALDNAKHGWSGTPDALVAITS